MIPNTRAQAAGRSGSALSVLAGALVLAGCGSSAPPVVRGDVTDMYVCCTGHDPWAAVATGVRVQVLAPDGSVVGTGKLGGSPFRNADGGPTSPADQLPFRVAVPPETFYMLRILGVGVVSMGGAPEEWTPGQRIIVFLQY
jgi:hypothetical protein